MYLYCCPLAVGIVAMIKSEKLKIDEAMRRLFKVLPLGTVSVAAVSERNTKFEIELLLLYRKKHYLFSQFPYVTY